VTPEVSPSPPSPPDQPAIASIDGTVETVNTSPFPPDKLGEGGNGDIFPDSPPDRPAIESLAGGETLTNKEKAAILGIGDSNLSKWVKKGSIPEKYANKCRFNSDKTKIILI
jgi:hypothetical protein